MARSSRFWLWVCLGLTALTGAVLLAMGRHPICQCGYVKLWHGLAVSSENSQHIADWYTPSHIVHGLIFYGILRWLRPGWSLGARLAAALVIECGWEIAENTPMVIERYRTAALALDYYGDSVVNSLSDVGAMALGFGFAALAPAWGSVALGLGLEIAALIMIRDNLTLNVIMLVWPIQAIADWRAKLGT